MSRALHDNPPPCPWLRSNPPHLSAMGDPADKQMHEKKAPKRSKRRRIDAGLMV
jgi:hypothetical protein